MPFKVNNPGMNPIAATPLIYRPATGLPRILHEDEQLLVVDKPPGLLSVPGRLPEHHDSALLRLQAVYGPLWVVHRLDMDTSGLIAFARTREAAANLGRQFERRTVKKTYEALVWGRAPSARGVIALPLRLDWPHRPRQLVDGVAGKPSTTLYERLPGGFNTDETATDTGLAPAGSLSRVRLTPVTGRSHQLRVHCSAIGLPIVGDRFYGCPLRDEASGATRLMLHARTLSLRHPVDGRPIEADTAAGF